MSRTNGKFITFVVSKIVDAMKKSLVFLFLFPLALLAQVSDDFSDGDFSNNPSWFGTDSIYLINSNLQLQQNATVGGTSFLSLPIQEYQAMEWHFWIREAFSPSGNNYSDVYLCADMADLTQVTCGYFLRFGEGGSSDAITLFRKDADGEQSICRGTEAAIAASFSVSVKVNCDTEGLWTIQTCYDDSGVYAIEAQGVEDTYPRAGYFGLKSVFTKTNAKRIYLDNVYVGPEIVDNEPPVLLSTTIIDAQHLQLTFSEALDEETALNRDNYSVDKGIGRPDSIAFGNNHSVVILAFTSAFANAETYTLTIGSISDLFGNVTGALTSTFTLFEASEYDVVINEIMADPAPRVGLPEWEFVELYNTTEFDIDLAGWQIQIGSNDNTFSTHVLPAHGYLVVCHNDAVNELKDYADCVGFGSFSIGNTSSNMFLISKQGLVISHVNFSNSWYHDADKDDGGWSVEQIDPQNPCAGAKNWTASVDVLGGSPGRLNSVNSENAIAPVVDRVTMYSNDMVQLWFDQQMEPATLMETQNYVVEHLGLHPQEANVNPNDPTFVELLFDYVFEEGVIYDLVIDNVANCTGNPIQTDTHVQFGIPNAIGVGDILINEIMFNPIAPGVDYVELYNPTDKTFDLSELMLGAIKESFPNPADTTFKEITSDSRLLLPQSYVLLSTNGQIVGQQYDCSTENFVEMASFPTFANSGGMAILMSKSGLPIDQMYFSEKMHYPLLKVTNGVSLERVSFTQASMDANNWHSAAESVHFGTPGYANSMMQNGVHSDDDISISPDVFSPDGDGFDDNCFVNYHFDEAGYTMNVYIFNVAGQLVRHLVKGELIATEGTAIWNGLDDRGNHVPLGVYVVITEVFRLDGSVKKFKNAAIVASR